MQQGVAVGLSAHLCLTDAAPGGAWGGPFAIQHDAGPMPLRSALPREPYSFPEPLSVDQCLNLVNHALKTHQHSISMNRGILRTPVCALGAHQYYDTPVLRLRTSVWLYEQ